jgi:hypothetical protein
MMMAMHKKVWIAYYIIICVVLGIRKVLTRYQYDVTQVGILVSLSDYSSKIVVLSIPTITVDAIVEVHMDY